jgi:hypothetical protein
VGGAGRPGGVGGAGRPGGIGGIGGIGGAAGIGAIGGIGGIGGAGGIGGFGGAGNAGNWNQNRNQNWNNRINNRQESWNQWSQNSQQRRDNFQQNRDDRWNNIDNAREDRQNWRDQNREDWQNHRQDMSDYRFDRAEEMWDHCGDHYDNCFDDHWWGSCGWGHGHYGCGHYPCNPWWWWAPVTIAAVAGFCDAVTPDPVYVDYGMTVIYEGETVYVDNKPMPAAEYSGPVIAKAAEIEQPPPPTPPKVEDTGKEIVATPDKPAAEEWMSLGIFALAQEKKGDPVALFQISVNKEGTISGGYQNALTSDKHPIAGTIDKTTQIAAWRVGDNKDTIYTTSPANLTQDVCTVAIHFGQDRVQEWLLVRMPAPQGSGAGAKPPELNRKLPPQTPVPVPKKN